jgi:hypothetical protein
MFGTKTQEFWFRNDHRESYVSSMLLTFFVGDVHGFYYLSIPCRLFSTSNATMRDDDEEKNSSY